MAPEMIANPAKADGKTADVFSLGRLLWKLATGQRYPLEMRETESVTHLRTILNNPAAGSLDALILSATAFDPSARPSMNEIHNALTSWLAPADTAVAPSVGPEFFVDRIAKVEASYKSEQAARHERFARRREMEEAAVRQAFEGIKALADANASVERRADQGFHGLVLRASIAPNEVDLKRAARSQMWQGKGWVVVHRHISSHGGHGLIWSGVSFDFRVESERAEDALWSQPIEMAVGHMLSVVAGGRRATWLLSPVLMQFRLGFSDQEKMIRNAVSRLLETFGSAMNEVLVELENATPPPPGFEDYGLDVRGQTFRLRLSSSAIANVNNKSKSSGETLNMLVERSAIGNRSFSEALEAFRRQSPEIENGTTRSVVERMTEAALLADK